MRRVLILVPKLSRSLGGGVGMWGLDLAVGFRQIGIDCWVWGQKYHDSPEGEFILASNETVESQALEICRFVRKHQIDVVLGGGSVPAFACFPGLPNDCLRIGTIHDSTQRCATIEYLAEPWLDGFVAVSDMVYKVAKEHLRFKKPIVSIPNGILLFPEVPAPLSKRVAQVLFVGRLDASQKRAHWLPSIWNEVKKKLPEAKLIVIGRGPLLRSLQKYAKNSSNGVEVLGTVDRSTVLEHIGQSMCYLSLSSHEGLSIATLEAMASGTPVVAPTNLLSHGGVLTTKNALLVEIPDRWFCTIKTTRSISNAILTVFKKSELAHSIVMEARRTIHDHHKISNVAERYVSFFKHVKISNICRCENNAEPYHSRNIQIYENTKRAQNKLQNVLFRIIKGIALRLLSVIQLLSADISKKNKT